MVQRTSKILRIEFIYPATHAKYLDFWASETANAAKRVSPYSDLYIQKDSKPGDAIHKSTHNISPSKAFPKALQVIERKIKNDDFVLTVTSMSLEDVVTLTHRDALKPKVSELAP